MLSRTSGRVSRLCSRFYATDSISSSIAPPMLLKIRRDMKSAMQAKDKNRLSVLRSLLSQTLNASKTSTPIQTDIQVLAMLRKTANASRLAIAEFRGAGREDLAEKEECQVKIMEQYAGSVETLGEAEIMATVTGVVDQMRSDGVKIQIGDVLKKLFAPEVLGRKLVERTEVAKVVRQVLSSANA